MGSALMGDSKEAFAATTAMMAEGMSRSGALLQPDLRAQDGQYVLERLSREDYIRRVYCKGRLLYVQGKLEIR